MSPKGKKRNLTNRVGNATLALKRKGRGVNGGMCEVMNAQRNVVRPASKWT